MMKKLRYFLWLVFILLSSVPIQSCSDDDKTPSATKLEVLKNNTPIESLDFQIPASSMMIGINCDADWTATVSDSSWVNISNHAGYGYDNKLSYIKVSVTRNTTEARQAQLTITSGSLQKVITISQGGEGLDPNDPFESSFSFVNNIKVGYNLGNTLDANPDIYTVPANFNAKSTSDWETSWGQPVTTQAIIDAIAAKGFNIIRIPVTWYPHMDSEGNIDAQWMARVKEVVDYVIKAGCYCIVNVHHDNGAKSAGRRDSSAWLVADATQYDAVKARYKKLWTQIATEFRNYNDKLLFESFNEILDKNYTWGDASDAGAYDVVNKLNQDFVDAVRATGGNNEYRNLVCNPYSAGHTKAKLDNWLVPQDVHPNHIVASYHTYDPYSFCNDNGQYNINIFDASCEAEIDAMIKLTSDRFSELGIPFIVGEFGAIDNKKSMSERIKYAKYMMTKLREHGTTGIWWMGLYDRKTATWYENEIADALMSVTNQ